MPRNPAQIAAIAESYRDKEKLVKAPVKPAIKPPKVPAIGKMSGIMPKAKVAGTIAPPRFGRKTIMYGERV